MPRHGRPAAAALVWTAVALVLALGAPRASAQTCAPGTEFYAALGRCVACNSTSAAPGGAAPCVQCKNGTIPNANAGACVAGCAAGFGLVALGGTRACASCAASAQVSPGGANATCVACPVGQRPAANAAACIRSVNATQLAAHYAAMTAGLTGQKLAGYAGIAPWAKISLYGNSFPLLLHSNGDVIGGAAVLPSLNGSAGGGRAVMFGNSEFAGRTNDATKTDALRFVAQSFRWLAGGSGGGAGPVVRVAGRVGGGTFFSMDRLANINATATTLGFSLRPAVIGGKETWEAPGSGMVTKAAGGGMTPNFNVLMLDPAAGLSADDTTSIRDFLAAGGGVWLSNINWGNAADYPANKLLAPFNTMQNSGDLNWASTNITVPATMPDLTKYNIDAGAAALDTHLAGGAQLTPDVVTSLTNQLVTAIKNAQTLDVDPAGSAWRGLNSSLAARALAAAAKWDCSNINKSDPITALAMAYLARQNKDLPANRTPAAPCAAAFPGLNTAIVPSAAAITVTVNASYSDQPAKQPKVRDYVWLSTGVYAAPGAPITATLPAGVALSSTQQIAVQIGVHDDDLTNRGSWCRQPTAMVKTVWFDSTTGATQQVASSQGGPVVIVVKRLVVLGPISISISGGVRMPFFQLGQTTNAQWTSTIRNYPAPWAEISSAQFVLTVPSSAVRAIDDMQSIASAYEGFMGIANELFVTNVTVRPNNERFVADCDTSNGQWRNAYPTTGPLSVVGDVLKASPGQTNDGQWILLRTWAKNFQIGAMTPWWTDEAWFNLFPVMAFEKVLRTDRSKIYPNRRGDMAALLAGKAGSYTGGWDATKFVMFTWLGMMEGVAQGDPQAGWDIMKRMMAAYQSMPDMDNGPKVQRLILEASKAAGRDLTGHFVTYTWPVDQTTKDAVAALKLAPMGYNASLPCGGGGTVDTCGTCCVDYYKNLGNNTIAPSSCPAGTRLNGTVCSQCGPNTISAGGAGAGVVCTACPAGTVSNGDNTACVKPSNNLPNQALYAEDYAFMFSGLAGQTIDFGDIGGAGEILLSAAAFPVINTTKGGLIIGAARLGAGGGRAVGLTRESLASMFGEPTTKPAAQRLFANMIRWAGGASGPRTRVCATNGAFKQSKFDTLNALVAAAGLNYSFAPPDGNKLTDAQPFVISSPAKLVSRLAGGAAVRTCDAFVGWAYEGYSDDEYAAFQSFLRLGGGVFLGSQAWTYGGGPNFAGNRILSPFNAMMWTSGTTATEPTYAVSSTPPSLMLFNPDAGAAVLDTHLAGGAQLAPDVVASLSSKIISMIKNAATLDVDPAGSAWRGFNSSLAARGLAAAAKWDCSNINKSQTINALAIAYLARQSKDLPPSRMPVAPCAAAFPGLNTPIAPSATAITVTVNASYPDQLAKQPKVRDYVWLSTGVYAAPGAPITVTLPASVPLNSTQLIAVQIGVHDDDLTNRNTWCRLPFPLTKTAWFSSATGPTQQVASSQGGPVVIVVKRLVVLGPISVSISGGVRMPFFQLGQTTNAQWTSTIRNYPAPWAEISSAQFVLTVPSSAVRAIDDMQSIASAYEGFMGIANELFVTNVTVRPNNERFVADCDTSNGQWRNAYPTSGASSAVGDVLRTSPGQMNNGQWNLLRTWAKNFQINSMTPSWTDEAWFNLFPIMAFEKVLRTDRSKIYPNRRGDMAALLGGKAGSYTGGWDLKFVVYTWLGMMEGVAPGDAQAGWDIVKRMMAAYQSMPDMGNDAKISRLIIETSKAAGRDLAGHFVTYTWPVDQATKDAVAALKLAPMGYNASLPCGGGGTVDTCGTCCVDYYKNLGNNTIAPSYCPPGTRLSGTICAQCGNNTISAGGVGASVVCTACPAGTVSNGDNTICVKPSTSLPNQALYADDYAFMFSGLAGQTIDLGDIGGAGEILLYGAAIPVINTTMNGVIIGASRLGAGGGRAIGATREILASLFGRPATTAPANRLYANMMRWAGGASGPRTRVCARNGDFSKDKFTALNAFVASAGLNYTFVPPDGNQITDDQPFVIPSLATLIGRLLGGAQVRTCDVFMGYAYEGYSDDEYAAIQNFLRLGGGVFLASQAWTYGGGPNFPGNRILGPFGTITWTSGSTATDPNYPVRTTAPPLMFFNPDAAAQAIDDHITGKARMATADDFRNVTTLMSRFLQNGGSIYDSPQNTSSAALWRSFNSTLYKRTRDASKTWNCTKLDPLDPMTILGAAYTMRENQDLPPQLMPKAPCADTFPGLGVKLTPDPTVVLVTVNASYPEQPNPAPWRHGETWLSTGIWAVAGAPVTVTLPDSIPMKAGWEFAFQIGVHTDTITHKSPWCRQPYGMVKDQKFTNATGRTITMASNQGGPVIIKVKRLVTYGDTVLKISGGVKMAFYYRGQTTDADWVGGIRSRAPPFAEIGSRRFMMTVPAHPVAVRNMSQPTRYAEMMDAFKSAYSNLSTYGMNGDDPRNERLVLDCDISAGWMHSGYPAMGYFDAISSDGQYGVLRTTQYENEHWGLIHEWGHNHQIGAMTWENTVEVNVNMWVVHAQEKVIRAHRTQRLDGDWRRQQTLDWWNNGVSMEAGEGVRMNGSTGGKFDFGRLWLYTHLGMVEGVGGADIEAGWEFYRRLLWHYYNVSDPGSNLNKQQRFMIESSRIANQNLLPFFQQWHWTITQATRDEIATLNLPPVRFNVSDPCGGGNGFDSCWNCCAQYYKQPSSPFNAGPPPPGWPIVDNWRVNLTTGQTYKVSK